MKNNNKIKEAFNEISVSKDLEEKILNKTIYKEEKRKFKYAYVLPLILLSLGLFMSIAYAEEIKEFFENWNAKITFENGEEKNISENAIYKKIPNTLKESTKEEYSIVQTHKGMEELLGFHLLSSPLSKNDKLSYITLQNLDGTIGRVDIWWPEFIEKENNKKISMMISMLNEKADHGYVIAFEEGINATGGKEYKNSYKIESLNTEVIIYGNDWDSERLTATFVYDNVLYELIADNIKEDELVEIIMTLK